MATLIESLTDLFLFRGLTRDEILWNLALVKPKPEHHSRGDVICTPTNFRRGLFVITQGECDVLQGSDDSRVVLNTLHSGDSFGIVSLFSEQEVYPTTVIARRETELLFLTRADVERMMNACPQISINLITFLTGRVEFLSSRVAALTAPTVTRKVAGHLLSAFQDNPQPLEMNRSHTAAALNCGRASLYRALDELEGKGLIACEGGKIYVLSPDGLERILQ